MIHFIPFVITILFLFILYIYSFYATINKYITLFGYYKITDKTHSIKDDVCINCKFKFKHFKINDLNGFYILKYFANVIYKCNVTRDEELSKLTCNQIIIKSIML